MRNFTDAQRALETAIHSTNSAWEENERYMESIQAHQNKLKAEWEKLVLSAPIEDLEKHLLDTGTALLKFANSDLGQTIIKVTAFTTAILGLSSAFTALSHSGGYIGILLTNIAQLIKGEMTLTAVTTSLTTALLSNPLFWGALAIAGIVAVIEVVDALSTSFEEASETLKQNTNTYQEATNNVKTLTSQLQELLKQQEEVNKQKIEITDDEELAKLQRQTNELERQEAILRRQLVLEKAKAKEAQDAAQKSATETYNKKYTRTEHTTEYVEQDAGKRTQGQTVGQYFEKDIQILQDYQQRIADTNKQIEELSKNEKENKEQLEQLEAQQEKNIAIYDDYYESAIKELEVVNQLADQLGEQTKAYDGANISFKGLIDNFAQFIGWSTDATDTTNNFVEVLDEENEEVEDSSKIWDEYIDNIEDIQSAYETLIKAVDEYNENGYITAATLKKLNKLNPEYLALLAQEGDAYTNITEGLDKYLQAEKDDAQMKVELARQIAIVQACQDKLAESSNGANDEIKKVGDMAEEVSPQMAELARKTTQAAIGMIAVKNAGKMDEDFKSQLDDINKYFDGLSANIEKVSLGSAKSSKSASKSSKDAWVEAFKEEQRQLKHSLEMNEITEIEYYQRLTDLNEKYFGEISGKHEKYIKEYQENEEEIYKGTKAIYDKVKNYLKEAVENGYEKAINALKKEEKAVLAEIKKQLEALKDEKKKVLDNIKDEINALKREKEQVQKYYNDQIDAIKKENEVLQEQNQLLEYQQKLQEAKAQKVMVFSDGKFQLGENESAVSQAEQNLSNYQDQLSYEQQIQQLEDLRDAQVEAIEARIESLEEYYDYMEEYYDKQIESMEEYSNRVQEQYEKQIEALQTELDTFKEGYQKAEDLENAKLAASVLAANEEAAVWQTRLENLANAVSEYNRLIAMIGEEGATTSSAYQVVQAQAQTSSHVAEADASIATRASGDASFKNDEIALVGESPNAELVIGSRLNQSVNSGTLMHLAKGSGVVNAESTQTLAGLLNGLSTPSIANSNRSVQQNFNFGTLSLPNVSNAETFVGALRDKFNNYSIQYSTKKQ